MTLLKDWFIKTFWTGYSWFERIYLASMILLQIIVFIIVPDTPIAIISGLAGVISTVLCAKGKFAFYFIGFVQTLTYLYLAWDAKFYGEVLENIFYLVTMVWGIFVWKKNLVKNEDGTEDIASKKFTAKQWFWSVLTSIVVTFGLGYVLEQFGSAQAYTDAATNILAIFAQLMMVRRYREQWLWWIVIDVLCIKLWWVDGNWSMVAMYIAWTINCIYGWVTWSKLNKTQTTVLKEG